MLFCPKYVAGIIRGKLRPGRTLREEPPRPFHVHPETALSARPRRDSMAPAVIPARGATAPTRRLIGTRESRSTRKEGRAAEAARPSSSISGISDDGEAVRFIRHRGLLGEDELPWRHVLKCTLSDRFYSAGKTPKSA